MPYETVAPFIVKMFELYGTGNYTLDRLRDEMEKQGLRSRRGRRLSHGRVHETLRNPFYYGRIRFKGEDYDGKHEPVITRELFEKVQKILSRKTFKPFFTKHDYLFKGKIVCAGCGGLVAWELQKGKFLYGHCNNHGKSRFCEKKTYIREERVEEQILEIIEQIAPKNKEMLDWVVDVIKSHHEGAAQLRDNEAQRISILLAQVRHRKDRLYEDKLDGQIAIDFYERKFAEYSEEEEELEASLAQINGYSDEYQQLGVVIHELAYKARQIYQRASVDEKRLLLSQLFTNLVQDGDRIRPNFTLAAQYLQDWMPKLNQDYELVKSSSTNAKDAALSASRTVWGRLVRDVRIIFQQTPGYVYIPNLAPIVEA